MRILMTIAYDGTNFSFCQKQKLPEVRTVEGELEKALRKLFRDPVLECIGASRTDAGVHALGQRAVVDVETTIPAEKIPLAVRAFLPEDIAVTKAEEVPPEFHPRFDCVKKTYEYRFWNAPAKNPKERLYSAHQAKPLDVEQMNRAASAFIGRHDFAAFCAAGSSASPAGPAAAVGYPPARPMAGRRGGVRSRHRSGVPCRRPPSGARGPVGSGGLHFFAKKAAAPLAFSIGVLYNTSYPFLGRSERRDRVSTESRKW